MQLKTLLARLVLLVSFALVPALAFQAYGESRARHTRQLLVEEEALRLVRLVSSEQQRILDGAEQVLATISGAPAVQDNDPAACQRLLANLMEHAPRYNSAAVIGLDGHPVCAPVPFDRGINVSGSSYFPAALKTGGFVIGEYAIGRISGKPGLHMARPLINRNGTVAGVVHVTLDLGWLGEQLKHLALPQGAVASVVDRNGTVLARYPDGMHFVGEPIPAANRFALAGDKPAIFQMTSLGQPLIVGYSPPGADPKGLLIKVGLDRDVTFAAMTQENREGLVLIFAGGLAALLITALAGGRLIRRPLEKLLDVADRWRGGDFTARTGLRPDRSEFGRLAAAFDRMAVAQEVRERALRMALESTTDNVIVLDRSWRITYLNARAREQVAPGRDVLGQVYWDAFPGAAESPFGQAYRAAMERGVPTRVSAPSVVSPYYFEAHAYPSDDGLTVFFHDVTEERRIAAVLREHDELFRATFEQAAVGIAQTGLDGAWLRVNDKLCAITGYPRQELVGHLFREITHPDDLEADLAQTAALLAGEIAKFTMEKRYLRKDGGVVWACLTVSLLHDSDGTPTCFIAIIEDITARKLAEAALRESETRLQLAREAAGFGVWERDLVTGSAIWSAETWQLHGCAPQPGGADRDAWLATIHPEDRARVGEECATAIADPARPFDTEYRVACQNGRVLWLLNKGKVIRTPDGKPLRIVGLCMDVTAGRETEAALRRLTTDLEARVREEVAAREAAQARAAQAERLQALGQLAGGIAHDFNNVLQAVSGAAAMVEIHPGDQANVLRFARRASDAVERGASITRRLLAFGRRADLRAEPIDVADLLSDLNEMLSHTLGAAIDVNVTILDGLAPLLADRGQLETALVNLATNARDAMPAGGKLTLSAAAETVLADSPGHKAGLFAGRYVRLAVADTGMGMEAATLARACEPFFTTKGTGAGTGLGLAMARGFAEQSGGALSIASLPGHGTTVTLWLPEAHADLGPGAKVSPAQAAYGAGVPAAHPRLLLVDDEEMIREVLGAYLEQAGYRVLVATNGAEALALLAAGEVVDALITDLSMPGMDGNSLIRAAQQRLPGLPAVLLTGYVGDSPALAAGEAGAFSLLRKPVGGPQLVACIRVLLKESQDSALDQAT